MMMIVMLAGCTIDIQQQTVEAPTTTPAPPPSMWLTPADAVIPITWDSTNITGRLIYSTFTFQEDIPTTQFQMLDLATGEIRIIFTVTGNAWVYYLSISPDGKQLLMSYTPPFEQGAESYTSLYTAPLDEPEKMELLFLPQTPSDRYTQAEWSPDGKSLYFVHYNFWDRAADELFPRYEIFRMAYPEGESEKIIDQGFWLRPSLDGSKLVYIGLDAVSGANKLMVANGDGGDPQEVALNGFSPDDILDAPIFTPDGQSILFSAPVPVQAYEPNWLDRLFGVQSALAHDVPSDWWSVPVSGGEVTRLTRLQTVRLFGSISPDQQHLASLSGDGIFVMDFDGSNLMRILHDTTVSSALIWLP